MIYAASTVREVAGDERALKVARDAFDWLERMRTTPSTAAISRRSAGTGRRSPAGTEAPRSRKRTDRLGVYYGYKTMNFAHPPAGGARGAVAGRSTADRQGAAARAHRPRPRQDRRRAGRAEPLPDPRLEGDPRARLVRPRRRDGLSARRGGRGAWHARRRQDLEVARRLVDHALDWGWDEQHGGFYDKGESFGNPAYDTKKVWWTEAEGLNALPVMDRKYGEETDRYAKAFRKQWDFIEKHLLDPVHGGWFAETTRDGP